MTTVVPILASQLGLLVELNSIVHEQPVTAALQPLAHFVQVIFWVGECKQCLPVVYCEVRMMVGCSDNITTNTSYKVSRRKSIAPLKRY